ncbi:MAG: alpha/beta hydrolase [Candidatus Izimaplasma sp.]|nr:alpha/beta hydrolase [Candidatus Izimaplasma bacterium]
MKHQVITLKNSKATLTTYIHDFSEEMKDMTKRKAILILPGGGYQFCSDREAEPIALSYNQAGFQAFVLRYTLHDEGTFEDSLTDAFNALKMIKQNADKWFINPNHIAVIGFSAGGHLAAHLSNHKSLRPNACLLGYPAILTEKTMWPYPTPTVDEKNPPTFIFHTFKDEVVPVAHSLYYAGECDQHNVPFEHHIFNEGPHGLSLATLEVANKRPDMIQPRFQVWLELSIGWLNSVFQ